YCGSLFLAACEAASEIANAMDDPVLSELYDKWLAVGKKSFERKLWTGSYYRIDTDRESYRIMSDQLCGQWYAKACGLPDIVPPIHARRSYQTIYSNNLKKFDKGRVGPVNVIYPNGKVDRRWEQTQEVWVGVAWSVAAGMLQEGLRREAEETGMSLYNTCWKNENAQLWFNSPEAYQEGGRGIRAPYYMRVNAVWALKHAYDISPEK
ncbi:MAG TPA: GH116 family glycosyl hydrolase, partial [Spirochaetota bacterium]